MVQTVLSEKKIKISKFENRKKSKIRVFFVCVRVCEMKKWVYFQMCDAVKRQEMPNLSLSSVSERVLCAKWTIIHLVQENVSERFKMRFCFFKLKIPKKMCSYSIKSVLLRKVSLKIDRL